MRVKDWNLGGPVVPGLLRLEEEGPLAVGRWGDEWNAPLIAVAGGDKMDCRNSRRWVGGLSVEYVCLEGCESRKTSMAV